MAPSCASAVREGGVEASVGVHAGWVIEPRNQCFRVPTSLNEAGGNIVGGVFASRWRSCAVEEPVHGKRRTTGMEKGMEESYIEDPASHGGPDHALATREGAAKRWIGVHAGRDMEPRNGSCPGCRRAHARRKATPPVALLRVAGGSRGVEEPEHACDLFMLRTGRSRGRPCLSLMPRPGWFGGWRVGGRRAARGRLRP
jgi:hypothetical protein